MLTTEQKNRVLSAMTETCRLLEKEMQYQERNRNNDMIAFYKSHIAKLEKMLEGN